MPFKIKYFAMTGAKNADLKSPSLPLSGGWGEGGMVWMKLCKRADPEKLAGLWQIEGYGDSASILGR